MDGFTWANAAHGLLMVLWEMSVIPMVLAGLLLVAMIGGRLTAEIPGPRRDLRVHPFIINWPAGGEYRVGRMGWRPWLRLVGLAILIAAPGAVRVYVRTDDGDAGSAHRIAWGIAGLFLLYLAVGWCEWLARMAAWRRKPAIALVAPLAMIAAYGIACRVMGAPTVDGGLLNSAGWALGLIVMALICAALLGAAWLAFAAACLTGAGAWLSLRALGRNLRRR
jgi:hypothetical protein